MLLTNDGVLIEAMMRGSAGHEKEYVVKTNQEVYAGVCPEDGGGVYLSEADVTPGPAR